MQNIFKRHEAKYLITKAQKALLLDTISQYVVSDKFDEYIVQNLYYDTENWDIIHRSIEKPLFKEKMRLRCYGLKTQDSKFFLELKKKYKGIVYKRRIAFSGMMLSDSGVRDIVEQEASQIAHELDFYLKSVPVRERMYLSYKRSAYAGTEDSGLRMTFDTDVRYRVHDLDFKQPDKGSPILSPEKVIMEIKVPYGMPLWLVQILSENEIYPASFSKCGVCYADYVQKQKATGVA